jgi:hypothetical protein
MLICCTCFSFNFCSPAISKKIVDKYNSSSWNGVIKDNRDILEKLLKQTGFTEQTVNNFKDYTVCDVIDSLYCMKSHGESLPGGMTDDDFNTYMDIFNKCLFNFLF